MSDDREPVGLLDLPVLPASEVGDFDVVVVHRPGPEHDGAGMTYRVDWLHMVKELRERLARVEGRVGAIEDDRAKPARVLRGLPGAS